MLNKLIIILLIFFNSYAAQSYIIEDKPAYFQINADTIGVPIYIDGALIGHTPIENPIPVLAGIHHITHQPPSIRDPFLQYGQTDGVKQIYVMSGDTVKVRLDTYLFSQRLLQMKKEYYYTNYIGIGISLLIIWQLWIVAN